MTRKPIGSQWLFNPAIAGYGTVWRPAVATIHHYIMPDEAQPPAKNGAPLPPRRDYTVTLPGGLFLFANDESLSDKDAPLPVAPPAAVKTTEEIDEEIRAQEIKLFLSLKKSLGITNEELPEVLREVDLGFPQATGA